MNLIIQLTAQLKEMENEMDKLVQENKASMEEIPVTAIPIASTAVPSTSSSPLPTIVAVTTTIPVTTEVSTTPATTPTTTVAHPNDEASKLIKAMQDMSIQTNKINRLKEQVKCLEDEKKLVQIMHKAETQKSNRLTERIHKL